MELVTLGNAKPFQALREELTVWADTMHRTIWENAGVGRITGILWGNPNRDKTREILNLNRKELSLLMEVLTGHSTLRMHLHRIGRADSAV